MRRINYILSIVAVVLFGFSTVSALGPPVTPIISGGTGTSTAPAGWLLYGGWAGVYQAVATGTISSGSGISLSATRAAVGGPLQITNTGVLSVGGTGVVSSSGGQNPSITVTGGSNGQVLAWASGAPTWVATSTLAAGTGISTALSGNTWTITNTAPSIGDPFTPHTTYAGQSVSATSTGIWFSGSPLSVIASSTFTTYASTTALTNSGPTWMTALAAGGLAVDANHKLYTGPTSTLSTISGQLDLTSQVTGDLPFSNLAQVSANSVLGNISGATADAASVSTTSLFAGVNGQVLGFSGGKWVGLSTTTLTNGTGITTAYNAGIWTVTNTGVISNSCPGGFLTCSGTNPSSFTLGTLGIANGGTGSTTAPAGQVIYGGATAYQSAATGTVQAGTGISVTAGQSVIGSGLTITNTGVTSNAGDWAGTWQTFSPSHFQVAGSYLTAYDAFTHPAVGQSATTSLLQFFGQASTSELTATSTVWLTSLGTPAGTILAVDPTGKIIATSTSAGGVTAVTGVYPIQSSGGSAPAISSAFGTTSNWGIANDQLIYTNHTGVPIGVSTSTLTPSSPFTGSFTQIGSGGSLGCQTASGSQAGCLAAIDWSHFNSATTTFTAPLVYTLSTNAVTLTTSGTWSGNAGTATALAANGTNCSAGNYPLGVDASGNSENCTAVIGYPWTAFTTYGTTTVATSSSIYTAGAFYASSTVATSTFDGPVIVGAKAQYPLLQIGSTTPIATNRAGNFFNIVGNDNTINGVQGGCTNVSGGPSAYCGFYLNNDLADNTVTHFGFLGLNSSKYTDQTFGTIFGFPNLMLLQNTDGPIDVVMSTTTSGKNFFGIFAGGTASSSEKFHVDANGASTTALIAWSALGIPNASSSPTLAASANTANIAIDSNAGSSSVRYADGAATRALFPDGPAGLPFASSTLAYMGAYGASGTTTIMEMQSRRPLSLLGFYCNTDVGTAYVTIGNGTASTTQQCTTSGPWIASTVTWTIGQKLWVAVGTQASSPNVITVSPDIRKDAD